LHRAGDIEFKTFEELVSNLKRDNKVLFKFLLTYYFEQKGFDAHIKCTRCEKECKIRKHAVAMIKSFNEVNLSTEEDAKTWFERFGSVYKEEFEGQNFNSRKLKESNFRDLCRFYLNCKLNELRSLIRSNKIEEAFRLLKGIKGIGDKIAKYIVRDLVFYFTD